LRVAINSDVRFGAATGGVFWQPCPPPLSPGTERYAARGGTASAEKELRGNCATRATWG
jgi:hypothetical protein